MSCSNPREIFIRSAGHAILVPCGKCAQCLNRKKNSWIHRIEQEKLHGEFQHSYFVTLTYDDDHLPYESYSRVSKGEKVGLISTGESLLNPYDLRQFLNRFRIYSGEKIRYFACGEYGSPDKTKRPHFHIVLFTNLNWQDTSKFVRLAWSRLRRETSSERYYRIKKFGNEYKRDAYNLSNRISFGRDQVRSVSYKRICYVAKYVNKILADEVVPPFFRCSKGLGDSFLNSDTAELCSKYNRHFTYFESNGLPVALSRYYASKLFTPLQMDQFSLKMINAESLPVEVAESGNREEIEAWYHYQCTLEKQKQIRSNLNYYRIPHYA